MFFVIVVNVKSVWFYIFWGILANVITGRNRFNKLFIISWHVRSSNNIGEKMGHFCTYLQSNTLKSMFLWKKNARCLQLSCFSINSTAICWKVHINQTKTRSVHCQGILTKMTDKYLGRKCEFYSRRMK